MVKWSRQQALGLRTPVRASQSGRVGFFLSVLRFSSCTFFGFVCLFFSRSRQEYFIFVLFSILSCSSFFLSWLGFCCVIRTVLFVTGTLMPGTLLVSSAVRLGLVLV